MFLFDDKKQRCFSTTLCSNVHQKSQDLRLFPPHRINNIVSCVSISNGATVHASDLFALLARSYRLPWLSRYPGRPEVNKIPFQNPHVTGTGEEKRDVPTAEVYKSNS
jgi:hypothetical protein